MPTRIAHLSIIPVRGEPSEKSEMTTQLLFGDLYTVLNTEKGWVYIEVDQDGYRGWVSENMVSVQLLSETPIAKSYMVEHPLITIQNVVDKSLLHLSMASRIYLPSKNNTLIDVNGNKYAVDVPTIMDTTDKRTPDYFAQKYLNAPYLWGGRSIFGIDCSALVQNCFMICGTDLPRDAYKQIEYGQVVSSVKEIIPNDLAFFHNSEGRIVHVGILLSSEKIIHASGNVRFDRFDEKGIFNAELKRYTHSLAGIRRII